jgi:hypothetical protein
MPLLFAIFGHYQLSLYYKLVHANFGFYPHCFGLATVGPNFVVSLATFALCRDLGFPDKNNSVAIKARHAPAMNLPALPAFSLTMFGTSSNGVYPGELDPLQQQGYAGKPSLSLPIT